MYTKFQQHLQKELADIEAAGLYKHERIIEYISCDRAKSWRLSNDYVW